MCLRLVVSSLFGVMVGCVPLALWSVLVCSSHLCLVAVVVYMCLVWLYYISFQKYCCRALPQQRLQPSAILVL